MKHNHIIKIILLSVCFGLISIMVNTFSIHAMTMGPWERSDDTYQPVVQPVHNGNQIYYSVTANGKYKTKIDQAVADWNHLNVINLVQVPATDSRSQITITNSNQPNQDDPSETTADTYYDNYDMAGSKGLVPDGRQAMFNTTITLYPEFNHDTKTQQKYCLEHEIGHALGFDHDNRTVKGHKLVMYWNTPFKQAPLGGLEQRMLASYYQLPINGPKLTTKY